MKFVVDVGVGRSAEQLLTTEGHEVMAVRERNPHLPDEEILAWAYQEEALVVTMDKDFGDLVWKNQLPNRGIILLRLEDASGPERTDILCRIVREFAPELSNSFAVYKNDRLRIIKRR